MIRGWFRSTRSARSARGEGTAAGREKQPVLPVTVERIEDYLRGLEYNYEIDEDGDPTGVWDGNRLWFILMGEAREILQVRGRWHNALELPSRTAALRAVNDWNRERVWPKVYLRDEEPGLILYAEVSVDLEFGATDAQLGTQLDCGIATTTMVLNSVSSTFTPPVG